MGREGLYSPRQWLNFTHPNATYMPDINILLRALYGPLPDHPLNHPVDGWHVFGIVLPTSTARLAGAPCCAADQGQDASS